MARELEARVATVVSETRIALNKGARDGVAVGDSVVIWRDVQVRDPETGVELGSVRLENLHLEVDEVQDSLALASVSATSLNVFSGLFKPAKVIASSNRALDADRVKVSVGDSVTVFVKEAPTPVIADELNHAQQGNDDPQVEGAT